MTLYYIDPIVSSGGSGTLNNPYALSDGLTAFNALSGDQSGNSWLFKAGTFSRLPSSIGNSRNISNFTLGYYGTGAKPILAGSAIKVGTWTQYDTNTWSIAHTRADQQSAGSANPGWDGFYYGGQAVNGVIQQSNPHGIRLTPVYTLALCQANAFTNFYDSTNHVMYVNLGGGNPNNTVMEYTSIRNGFDIEASPAGITLDHLIITNVWDCGIYFTGSAGAANFTMTHCETDQCGSVAGIISKDGCQLIGDSSGAHTRSQGLLIDDFKSTNHFFGGLNLLRWEAGLIHNLTIDACQTGLGLWDDIVGCVFSQGRITNIVSSLNYNNLPSVQTYHTGIRVYGTGSGGANGYSSNNCFTGYLVANTEQNCLYHESGSAVYENCTFYGTSNMLTSAPYNSTIRVKAGTTPTEVTDIIFSNNLVITDQPTATPHVTFWADATTSNYIHGNKNVYLNTNTGDATKWRSVTNGATTNTSFAAWQAAIGSQMDANSVFIAQDNLAPSVVNYGTLSTVRTQSYLSGFDLTPRNKVDGYVSDSQMVGFGSVLYPTATTVPANGALTQSAAGALAATTYYVVCTWSGINGETLASAETSLAVSLNNVLNVAAPASPPAWAVGWNVYVSNTAGGGSGKETRQNAVPIGTASAWVEPTSGLITGAVIPKKGPLTVSPEDANGNPFEPNNMPCGAIQNLGACAPPRQKRASGSW